MGVSATAGHESIAPLLELDELEVLAPDVDVDVELVDVLDDIPPPDVLEVLDDMPPIPPIPAPPLVLVDEAPPPPSPEGTTSMTPTSKHADRAAAVTTTGPNKSQEET